MTARFAVIPTALALIACGDPCGGRPPCVVDHVQVHATLTTTAPLDIEICVGDDCARATVDVGACAAPIEPSTTFGQLCLQAGDGGMADLDVGTALSTRPPPSDTWRLTVRDGDRVLAERSVDVALERYEDCGATCTRGRVEFGAISIE